MPRYRNTQSAHMYRYLYQRFCNITSPETVGSTPLTTEFSSYKNYYILSIQSTNLK